MTRVVRAPYIAPTVAVVDGIPGCGKTLVAAVVSSLERVELEKYDYTLEYLSQLWRLDAVREDVAGALAGLLTDQDLYDVMMARETNFRPADLSSVWRNPRPLRYLRRLLEPGDKAVLERVAAERPILNLVTCNVLAGGKPVFKALGERLRVVEAVRHPLYGIKQWRLYMERYGADPRDFTLWIDRGGQALPWFAAGWESEFLAANPMDRAIRSMDRLLGLCRRTLEELSPEERGRVLVLPFESFVKDPEPHLARLEAFLGTRRSAQTPAVLAEQKVPRAVVTAGLDLACYREAGWQPPAEGAGELEEMRRLRAFAAAEASPEGLALLDRLCAGYEKAHMGVAA